VCVCVCVCVPVCPRAYLLKYTCDLYQIFSACYLWPWLGPSLRALRYVLRYVINNNNNKQICIAPLGRNFRGAGLLGCTSGFMDDVILAHKPRQLIVAAQLMEAQPTCSLGLGYKRRVGIPVAGQLTTFRALRSGLGCTVMSAFIIHVGIKPTTNKVV